MNIALFSVSGELSTTDGNRLISSLLKQAGHSVTCVFLPRNLPNEYTDQEIAQLHEILRNADIAMLGIFTPYVARALQITKYIRKHFPDMQVAWGGPHCISAPELSLPYADIVCYGEAEEAVVDLINKMDRGEDYFSTKCMAFNLNLNGKHLVNRLSPQVPDLNTLPYFDNGFENHFILDTKLIAITKENSRNYFEPYGISSDPGLFILTARGCPFKCTYCNNVRYLEMYGKNKLRFRDPDHFIGEIEKILNTYDIFKWVALVDDDFMARPKKNLEEFAEKYKKRIDIPFGCAVTANSYKKEKMEILLDAGLAGILVGVQSLSQRVTDEVFDRGIKITKTVDVVDEIVNEDFKPKPQLSLDLIIDNPYEEGDETVLTYNYLLKMADAVDSIRVHSLTFYPGTPLYNRALKDGLIEKEDNTTTRLFTLREIAYKHNYEHFLIMLAYSLYFHKRLKNIPHWIMRLIASKPVRRAASLFPNRIHKYSINKVIATLPAVA